MISLKPEFAMQRVDDRRDIAVQIPSGQGDVRAPCHAAGSHGMSRKFSMWAKLRGFRVARGASQVRQQAAIQRALRCVGVEDADELAQPIWSAGTQPVIRAKPARLIAGLRCADSERIRFRPPAQPRRAEHEPLGPDGGAAEGVRPWQPQHQQLRNRPRDESPRRGAAHLAG